VRRPLPLLLAVLVASTALPASALALDEPTLVKRMATYERKLGPASAAHVIDLATGETLYSRNPDMALSPASNEKLFTTAAAMLRFGPTATLTTTVRAAPGVEIDDRGRLDGDLYLIGAGDPALGDTGLRSLAAQVRAAGVRKITGAVRGDESRFDALRGGPDSSYGPDRDLGGVLTALSWAHGAARTGGPAATAARRFARLLKAQGIAYSRRARAGALPDATVGAATAESEPLASWASPSMRALAAATNLPSDNFYAEMLIKNLGAEYGAGGTTSAGIAVARTTLAELQVAPTMVDGSGLSRRDQTTARALVQLLSTLDQNPIGTAWEESLPVAGVSGTLRRRMRGTAAAGRCAAKTGTLTGVSALSGVCRTTGGRRVAFSLLENRVCSSCAKAVEDRIVASLAAL
jgi:D-alanyl-D-alanine carboxypeptidase/D-alanyl-D-alanine-endopeptidase (penicillin-binding protein 4)